MGLGRVKRPSEKGAGAPTAGGPPPFPLARTNAASISGHNIPRGLALYGIATGDAERAEERHVSFIEAVVDGSEQQEWRQGRP